MQGYLTLPKEKEGVGFPDLVRYQEATHLARVEDWCLLQKRKPWVHMEQAMIDFPLEGLVWLPETDIPQAVRRNPMVGATFTIY